MTDDCRWPDAERDAQGCLPISFLFQSQDCLVPTGACFAVTFAPVDSRGHVVAGDDVGHECRHQTPASENVRKKEKVMSEQREPRVVVEESSTTVTMLPTPGNTNVATTISETIGAPPTAVADIKQLIPADGNANGVTVALALVSVAGGGAAFKLYQNMSKNKHEQRMKELDQKQDGHEQCAAQRLALDAKVQALEARIQELQSRPTPEPELPDVDFDDMRDRLAELEKALKPKTRKKTGR
jgi:DNA-binding transcriptional MerR regulator